MTGEVELELVRAKGDRRLYSLADLGTIRLVGLWGRNAIAQAAGETWSFERGVWTRTIRARDSSDNVVGEFRGRLLSSGGTLGWRTNEFTVRKASLWRERYALVSGESELALFDVRAWGRTPVFVRVAGGAQVEAGLLLFTAFVVRAAAEDNSTSAGGAVTASTAATAG